IRISYLAMDIADRVTRLINLNAMSHVDGLSIPLTVYAHHQIGKWRPARHIFTTRNNHNMLGMNRG
ncbi:hypothetical protein NTB88_06475, partial [Aeromonas salmonicida]|nr:hypothetical protein [Aeromonas salmonicida]